jgi:hypothetical protein
VSNSQKKSPPDFPGGLSRFMLSYFAHLTMTTPEPPAPLTLPLA